MDWKPATTPRGALRPVQPALLTGAVLLIALRAVATPRDALPPNIVLIIADDHAYRDFGFMGNPHVDTPSIDELARASARYINGYVPTSVCRPSLATLLTGLYPHQHGIFFNHPPPGYRRMQSMTVREWENCRAAAEHFIRRTLSLPRVLADCGYAGLQTGKHWEGDYRNAGFTHGMTRGKPSAPPAYGNRPLRDGVAAHGNGDAGLAIGRDTMAPIYEFVDAHADKPFFIWYAPFLPHAPFDAGDPFRERYQDRRGVAEHLVGYYASITRFDATVGELIDFFERKRLADRTIFLFVCDNGYRPSTRPDSDGSFSSQDRRSKLSPYEDGVRTPILIRWDGHIEPRSHEQLVQTIDIVPTVLAAAGVSERAKELPGIDLLSAALGESELPERPAFGEVYPNDASSLENPSRDLVARWVRLGDYKLIVPGPNSQGSPWWDVFSELALFRLSTDPREEENLATNPEFAADKARLQKLLDDWWTPAAPSFMEIEGTSK